MGTTARTSTETMTGRERMLATLRREEVDRYPVWLKMTNRTWQSSQPEPYRSMGDVDLLRATGCDLFVGTWARAQRHSPHVSSEVTETEGIRRTVMQTPDGELVAENTFDPYTESWHPTKFPADSLENLRRVRWLYTENEYAVSDEDVERLRGRQEAMEREDAVTFAGIGPSPLMNLIEHVCGPLNATYLLHDDPELFREVVDLMHADRMKELSALLPAVPADCFSLTENTTTTLISPAMFEEFCVPQLVAYGNLIIEHDMIAIHHMCGCLNALLESINRLPAQVNEAYTTHPVGDVTLADGRRRMPSKSLIGGTNATLWLAPVEEIAAEVAADLARCPDTRGIFLTSAGVLPPPVDFAKAKRATAALKAL